MGKKKSDFKLKYLSFSEWKRVERQEMPIRDRLIFRILYETGCTVNELVNIKVKDIELRQSRIRIIEARNKVSRFAYISDNLRKQFSKILKGLKADSFLLTTRQSSIMTTKRIRQLVHGYCLKVGIKDANPQIVRYTHIVHAYLKDVPLNEIQKQVGLKRSRAIELFSYLPEKPRKSAYRNFLDLK